MSMYPKREFKIKPKSNLFKSEIELKADIDKRNNTKEIITMKENIKTEKALTLYEIDNAPPIKLWLDSPKHVRQSISRIVRLVGKGTYPVDKAGKLCYLFQTLLQAWKAEDELSSYKEILEIKQMLKDMKNAGKM